MSPGLAPVWPLEARRTVSGIPVPEKPCRASERPVREVSKCIVVHGRHVDAGTEITVRRHGRVKFLAHVRNPINSEEWIDIVGKHGFGAVRVEDVETVHVKSRLR